MQAHDSVAVQEMAEENVTQYLGETVKLVRLEKARDTPLVTHQLLLFQSQAYCFHMSFYISTCLRHLTFKCYVLHVSKPRIKCVRWVSVYPQNNRAAKHLLVLVPDIQPETDAMTQLFSQYVIVYDIFVTVALRSAFRLVSLCSVSFKKLYVWGVLFNLHDNYLV